MNPEIRSARDDEMDEFMRVVRLTYALPPSVEVRIRSEWTMCAFEGNNLATTYAAWPLKMQFSGKSIPIAGITWVGTHPVFRRRGYLRKVVEHHLKSLYEKGEHSITALFASMASIYQRYGYGVVSTHNSYSVQPGDIQLVPGDPVTGDFREADEGDMDLLLELYHRFIQNRTGYLWRGKGMHVVEGNPFTVLNVIPPASGPVILIYYESGEPQGYLIYNISRDLSQGNPLGQKILIKDLVWLSPAAYRATWQLLSSMDLATCIEWHKVPTDDPLPHLMLEPKRLNTTSYDGLMSRIVDIKTALTRRQYSSESILSVEIIDDICPWNRGRWEIDISTDGTTVRPTTGGVQLLMPISTLAMLIFGQITASQGAEMGRLVVNDPDSLLIWDNAMKTSYRPFCGDSF